MDWASVVSSVLAVCLYINTLDSDFVYDDNRAILSNDDVLPDSPLSNLIFHDFWGTPLGHSGSHGSYRPVTVLSFRLNVLAAGVSARGFHAVNIALHAASTAAFVRVSRVLTASARTPWAAGLLFAAHPVHCEAVAGVVGRADVGAAFFLLLSLLAYTKHIKYRDKTYLLLALLLGACSMFSKEQGIAGFVICLVYEVLHSKQIIQCLIKRPSLNRAASKIIEVQRKPVQFSFHWLILSFCLLAALRTYLIGGKFPNFSTADNPAAKSDSFLTRTLTFFYLPVFNFCLLLCPSTLSFDWSMDSIPLIQSFVDKRNTLTVAFYSALIFISLKHIMRLCTVKYDNKLNTDPLVDVNSNHKYQHQCDRSASNSPSHQRTSGGSLPDEDTSRVVLMGVAMMVLPFIPATNLVAYVGFVVAERVLYIPSLGYCLLVGHGFATLSSSKSRHGMIAILLAGTLLLSMFAVRTIKRNEDWKNEESLYRSGIHINPPKAYGNLGNILSFKGNDEEAERCYKKALQFRPNMADVHYNLGVLLQSQQRWDEAIVRYKVAIECRSRLAVAYLNLGVVLGKVGRTAEAMSTLRAGASLDGTGLKDPRSHSLATTACLFHLGRLTMDQGDLQQAVRVFRQAVTRMPTHYQPQSLYNLLGEAYCRLGRDADAEPWFRAALSSKPDHVPAHLTYGRLLARNMSRIQEAEEWYSRAEALAPQDAGVLRHYGQFLLGQKRPREAVVKFERAMQLSSAQYEDAMNAATSLRLSGDLERAEVYYKLAVRLRPQDPSGIANLGALYHMIGRLQEAETQYLRALKLLPEDEVTTGNLRRLRRLQASQEERMPVQQKQPN